MAAFKGLVIHKGVLRLSLGHTHHDASGICTERSGVIAIFGRIGHVANAVAEVGNLHIDGMETKHRLATIAVVA